MDNKYWLRCRAEEGVVCLPFEKEWARDLMLRTMGGYCEVLTTPPDFANMEVVDMNGYPGYVEPQQGKQALTRHEAKGNNND